MIDLRGFGLFLQFYFINTYTNSQLKICWLVSTYPMCSRHFLPSPKPLKYASQLSFYGCDLMTYPVVEVRHINFLEFSNFNLRCQLFLSFLLYCENLISCLFRLLIEISTIQVTTDQFTQALLI